MSKTADLSPTSELPFAARRCDVPYLDLVENGAKHAINDMAKRIGRGAPSVQFAELTNEHNLQLQGWVEVLKTAEELLQWAHRGGSPSGHSANVCFARARSMLGLATGEIEKMGDDAAGFLDAFCESETG